MKPCHPYIRSPAASSPSSSPHTCFFFFCLGSALAAGAFLPPEAGDLDFAGALLDPDAGDLEGASCLALAVTAAAGGAAAGSARLAGGAAAAGAAGLAAGGLAKKLRMSGARGGFCLLALHGAGGHGRGQGHAAWGSNQACMHATGGEAWWVRLLLPMRRVQADAGRGIEPRGAGSCMPSPRVRMPLERAPHDRREAARFRSVPQRPWA